MLWFGGFVQKQCEHRTKYCGEISKPNIWVKHAFYILNEKNNNKNNIKINVGNLPSPYNYFGESENGDTEYSKEKKLQVKAFLYTRSKPSKFINDIEPNRISVPFFCALK